MLASSTTSLLALAGHSRWFQAAAIIIGTFILEDAATVAAAMQVEDGALPLWLALMSLYAGIVLGDLGLYGLGRLSAHIPWIARQLPPHRQQTIRAWISTVASSKSCWSAASCRACACPTYTTCGFVGADLRQFTLAAIVATGAWTSLLFATSLRRRPFPDGSPRRMALGRRCRLRRLSSSWPGEPPRPACKARADEA